MSKSKLTNVRSLGHTYTIANRKGEVVERVQLVTATQILESTNGPYEREKHGTFNNYLRKAVRKLENTGEIEYGRILWHINRDPDGVSIHDIVKQAYTDGFDTVIIEDLVDDEEHTVNT